MVFRQSSFVTCGSSSKVLRGFVAAAVLALPIACNADWFVNFVRISCIPESNHLSVEYKEVEGSNVLTDAQFDEKRGAERLRVWQRHGYFEARKLNYECRLPNATYRVVTTQDEPHATGTCGGAPFITLTLIRNGIPDVSGVVFGYSCAGEPSVMSIEASDPPDGWGSRYLAIEVRKSDQELNHFRILNAYDEHAYDVNGNGEKQFGDLPVTQQKVSTFAKEP